MKTAVIGLFDDEEDARRVLAQLVGSPLDLSTIQVVCADSRTERQLSAECGLPGRHHVLTGIIAGAVLGTALGILAGLQLEVFARLGTVLCGAGGLLVGGIIGGILGAMAGRLRLPERQDEQVLAAIDDGATAIVVRTENVPTARAIRDLFQAGGSRTASDLRNAAFVGAVAVSSGETDQASAPTPESGQPGAPPDDHSQFAPPHAQGEASESPGSV